jgi:dihydrolipoamide dehydrogenase
MTSTVNTETVNMIEADVAVIGGGTAGMTAYKAARARGKRAVLIEGGVFGTTCARVGCMPSKLLIAAADAAHALAQAPAFGVHPGETRIDGVAVMSRVRGERDRFVGYVLESVDQIPPEDKLHGKARFIGPGLLQIDAQTTVRAKSVVIAAGSLPTMPEEWKHAGERVICSDAVFDWVDLPRSVAVVGGGVIALELGQALHRLGVRITLFVRSEGVAHLSDPVVRHNAARTLGAEMDIRFQTRIVGLRQDGDEVIVTSQATGAHPDADRDLRKERYDYVLVAIGRKPSVAGLGLEHADIALGGDGVPLYDKYTMQCGNSPVFIAGDASDDRPLLPEAADQGHIAGDNAARYPMVQPGLRRTPLAIAFTEPQIATMGSSYKELTQTHAGKFAIGEVSFDNQGRSRVMLENKGVLRVYGEAGSGRFLGAEMFGPRAEHIGHLLAWACQARLTVGAMLDMPFYHPVFEEGVRTALRHLAANLARHSDAPCIDCTPGA